MKNVPVKVQDCYNLGGEKSVQIDLPAPLSVQDIYRGDQT